jgi:hypothetical protein
LKGVNRQDAKRARKTKMDTVNALSAKNEVRNIRIGKGVSISMWSLFDLANSFAQASLGVLGVLAVKRI